MTYPRLLLPITLFFFIFIGFACSSSDAIPSAVEISIINTATTSISPTSLPPAKTPLLLPTWTSLPTLSASEAQTFVTKLLADNVDCHLPCWWGVIPGQTRWQDAEASLSPIAITIHESTSEDSNPRHFEVFLPAPYPSAGKFRQEYLVENAVVKQIEILPQHFSKYSLPGGLLQELGNPETIFLGGSINQPQSFQLILYSPSQGTFALYSNELHPFQEQEVVDVCFTEAEIAYVDMYLWNPTDSFSETLDYIFGEYERPFYEIEAVTDLTISEFSDIFESGRTSCFKTPSSFWSN